MKPFPSNVCIFLRGFTKFNRSEYLKFKAEGKVQPDGVNAKVILDMHANKSWKEKARGIGNLCVVTICSLKVVMY